MKRTAPVRIAGDICFYFAVIGIFPALRPMQLAMAAFAAAAFLAALLAVRCRSGALRLLIALLPGLCFLLAPLRWLLIFPALAWLYLILMLTTGRFVQWLDDYRRAFRVMLIVCLGAVAANVAHSMVYRGQVVSYASMVYAVLFLCLGVIAMRDMQMNARMGAKWRFANALTVVGVPVLAIGASLLIYLLLSSAKPVAAFLLRPVGMFVLWLFAKLFPAGYESTLPTLPPDATPRPTPSVAVSAETFGSGFRLSEADMFLFGDPLLVEKATAIGGYVVLALLLAAAIFVVVRLARRGRVKEEGGDFLYEETEEAAPQGRAGQEARAEVSGSAQQIRRIYRKYLELMRQNGVAIRQDSTSLDVQDEAEQIALSPAARRLRELYLKARYGDGEGLGRDEVQEARRCLREIQQEETWKS